MPLAGLFGKSTVAIVKPERSVLGTPMDISLRFLVKKVNLKKGSPTFCF